MRHIRQPPHEMQRPEEQERVEERFRLCQLRTPPQVTPQNASVGNGTERTVGRSVSRRESPPSTSNEMSGQPKRPFQNFDHHVTCGQTSNALGCLEEDQKSHVMSLSDKIDKKQ